MNDLARSVSRHPSSGSLALKNHKTALIMIAKRGRELQNLERQLDPVLVERFKQQMASGDGSLYRPAKIDSPTRVDVLGLLQQDDYLEQAGFSRTPARSVRNKCALLNSGLELEVKLYV